MAQIPIKGEKFFFFNAPMRECIRIRFSIPFGRPRGHFDKKTLRRVISFEIRF